MKRQCGRVGGREGEGPRVGPCGGEGRRGEMERGRRRVCREWPSGRGRSGGPGARLGVVLVAISV